MKVTKIILSIGLLLMTMAGAQAQQESKTLITTTNYLLFLPKGYTQAAEQKWPLIVFLHGSGERGSDVQKVKVYGPPKIVETKPDFPFIVVSPQCPEGKRWSVDVLNQLLDKVITENKVDKDRIYLTGLSMGGYGTWDWATQSPERFAAIVPICGGGDPEKVWAIRNMPTWVFHGAKDQVVPLMESERMVTALKKINSNVKFTVYPEAGHDSWTEAYNTPELYTWLLSHQKKGLTAITVNPKVLDAYVGTYELRPDLSITVSKENDHLYGQATGQPKVELLPETEKDYFIKDANVQISFVKDAKGKVTSMIVHQNGDTTAKKIK
jgi:pimeloyl-ACP methyl ester carboxylesterase